MAEYLIQGETLDAIAEAINHKAGTQAAMTPAEMVTAIGTISGGGELPVPITQFATGTFTLADDSDSIQINHGIGSYPTLLVLYPDFDYVKYRRANKGISPSYVYNNFYTQGNALVRNINVDSGNILATVHEPLSTNFQGNTATISSTAAAYPFPSKWHSVEGDNGETITWRWIAIRLNT